MAGGQRATGRVVDCFANPASCRPLVVQSISDLPGCGRSRGPVPGGSYASDSPDADHRPLLAAAAGAQPPASLATVRTSRRRAGRWLPNPPRLFVGARRRGSLASGVPRALRDAVIPVAPGRARSGPVASSVRRSLPVVSAPTIIRPIEHHQLRLPSHQSHARSYRAERVGAYQRQNPQPSAKVWPMNHGPRSVSQPAAGRLGSNG